MYNQQFSYLESNVLGCHIIVKTRAESPCIDLAESILAGLESFLSTTIMERAFSFEPELTIEIRLSDFADSLITTFVENRKGRPYLTISCRSFNPNAISVDGQGQINQAILNTIVVAISHIVIFNNPEHDLEVLFRDERVGERAVAFASTFVKQGNILGDSPMIQIDAWNDNQNQSYPLQRSQPWFSTNSDTSRHTEDTTSTRIAQRIEPPHDITDPNLLSHDQLKVVSIIRIPLWNQAKWVAIGYEHIESYPPILAIVFKNREAGEEIFDCWIKEFSKIDLKNNIRLTIVRGIDQANPHAYRVVVATNPETFLDTKKHIQFICRRHRMDAINSENLDRFLEEYTLYGAFYLALGFTPPDFDVSAPNFTTNRSLSIILRQIHIRDAWEIGMYDIDVIGIEPDDNPIIPKGTINPPVVELLRYLRG